MKITVLKKIAMVVFVLTGLSILLLTGGCFDANSYSADAGRMVPTDFEIVNKHLGTVSIGQVTGSKAKRSWQVSNSGYAEALEKALVKSGLFKAVIMDVNTDYRLYVTILSIDQPAMGLDFNIYMKTKWELIDTKKKVSVWSDTFETTYKAKVSQALIAGERVRIASEGSARENIREGIKRLSLLKL
jgi:hypothetical protein